MKRETVRLFNTIEHACGYYPDRLAKNCVLDPQAPQLGKLYASALAQGFRRSGDHVYRPTCSNCQACVPTRVPVTKFHPSRSQRRCWQRNADITSSVELAGYSDEAFALYQAYLQQRHPGGGMDQPMPDDFVRSLYTDWSGTSFLTLRLGAELLGIAVTDVTAAGLSAVYTFFDPAQSARGLGVYAILAQIEWTRRLALPHLYLGYWIDGHPKMNYKIHYRPIECWREGHWQQLAI